jgi:glycine/D-amino acid oxidase-like deaminating enzyme
MKILIAGQGLAGTVLAFQLHQRGHEVKVMDTLKETSASRVAAGMWNPVSFRRVIPTWRAHTLIPEMHAVYSSMEQLLGIRVVHRIPVVRIFPNEEYARTWEKAQDSDVGTFLAIANQRKLHENISAPHGYGEVIEAGYVDLPLLLNVWQEFMRKQGAWIDQKWEGAISHSDEGVDVAGERYDAVVLCLGTGAATDPLTADWDFLRKNKGEVLTLKLPGIQLDHVLNKGKWLLPVGEETYRLGSSYEWQQTDLEPSPGVREQLLDVLKQMLPDISPEIQEHKVGIRPTVKDRRPVVGAHPKHPHVWVLNGLGTRGVMLAPHCASYLADRLEGKRELDLELDPSRFFI